MTKFVSLSFLMTLDESVLTDDIGKSEKAIDKKTKRNSIELELVKQLIASTSWTKIPNSSIKGTVPKGKTKVFFFLSLLLAVSSGCAIPVLTSSSLEEIMKSAWPHWWIICLASCVLFSFISAFFLYMWKPFSSFSIEAKDLKAEYKTSREESKNEFEVFVS